MVIDEMAAHGVRVLRARHAAPGRARGAAAFACPVGGESAQRKLQKTVWLERRKSLDEGYIGRGAHVWFWGSWPLHGSLRSGERAIIGRYLGGQVAARVATPTPAHPSVDAKCSETGEPGIEAEGGRERCNAHRVCPRGQSDVEQS